MLLISSGKAVIYLALILYGRTTNYNQAWCVGLEHIINKIKFSLYCPSKLFAYWGIVFSFTELRSRYYFKRCLGMYVYVCLSRTLISKERIDRCINGGMD
jgi:hypothetical protein